MHSLGTRSLLAAFAFAGILSAQQAGRAFDESIGEFRGLAKKAKDSNPVLATVEKGPGAVLGALGLGKSKAQGAGPIQVTLSKEQQEDVERRRKLAEKAEADAQKKPVARPKAKPVVTAKADLVPVGPPAPAPVTAQQPAAPAPPPAPPITIITSESLGTIAAGMDRESVISALGKPSAVTTIAGLEGGTRETLVYHFDPQHRALVKLLDGKVQSIAR